MASEGDDQVDREEREALDALRVMGFPPTDETGDVDLSIIEYNLTLTPAERIRQHDAAMALVRALRRATGAMDKE